MGYFFIYIYIPRYVENNIKDLMIIVKIQKTEIESIIPMLLEVLEILRRYNYNL